MTLSCPLGIIRCVPEAENSVLLKKKNGSKWLDIGAKKELGQCPTILTSRLVNNPCLITRILHHMLNLLPGKIGNRGWF